MFPIVLAGAGGYIIGRIVKDGKGQEIVVSEGHPLARILDELDRTGFLFYDSGETNPLLNLNLGVSRTNHEISIAGDFLVVETITGTATVKFNDKSNQAVSLNRLRRFTTPFRRLFINNTAQAGKTLVLSIGRDASFLAKALEAIKVADTAGNEINPSTKEAFVPLEVSQIHNTAKGAAAAFWGTAKAPTNTPCLWRIMVCLDTLDILSAYITNGANTQSMKLNGGVQLTADCVYIFDILVHSGDTVDFSLTTGCTIKVFRVQEIVGAVQ